METKLPFIILLTTPGNRQGYALEMIVINTFVTHPVFRQLVIIVAVLSKLVRQDAAFNNLQLAKFPQVQNSPAIVRGILM